MYYKKIHDTVVNKYYVQGTKSILLFGAVYRKTYHNAYPLSSVSSPMENILINFRLVTLKGFDCEVLNHLFNSLIDRHVQIANNYPKVGS